MKNKLVKTSGVIVTIAFCISFSGNQDVQKSGGAPVNVTRAPGEQTCSGMQGSKSCHSGGIADNSGPGTPSIVFSGGSTYTPGHTYTVTPTITHPTRNRFGFEIVCLKDSNNSFAGTVSLIDTTRTQISLAPSGSFPDRLYVTHLLAGTYPTTNYVGQWSYKWTAPSYNAGNISFYACFLAANNNNDNDPGDETYWKKITISPALASITETNLNNLHVSIYPNPCADYVYLCYYLYENTSVKAELFSAEGQFVKTLLNVSGPNGSHLEKIELPEVANGMYFIRTTIGKEEKLSRIYIQ